MKYLECSDCHYVWEIENCGPDEWYSTICDECQLERKEVNNGPEANDISKRPDNRPH